MTSPKRGPAGPAPRSFGRGANLRLLAGSCVLALAGSAMVSSHLVLPSFADDGARLIIAAAGNQAFPVDLAAEARAALAAPPSADAAPAAATLDPVVTAALYYYAKERQSGRVEAELRRLQALHPGFVAPADLYSAGVAPAPEETALWALYAAENLAGVEAEIIRRKGAEPDWSPTADFSAKLARKTQRLQMAERTKAEDWLGVLAHAEGLNPASEKDIDLVWLMADAHSVTGDIEGLASVLRGLLARTGDARLADAELVVTLQKALKDFPATEIRMLIGTLWPNGAPATIATSLRADLIRKEIADFNTAPDAPPVAPEDVRLLSMLTAKSRTPADLSLLGWYNLKLEKPDLALPLFEAAMEVAPDPDAAKGLYLSLSRQKLDDKAFDFATIHLKDLSEDPVFLMNVLSPRFGDPDNGVIAEDALMAYSTAIMETGAADHAEILGWYAYNSRQFEAAEAWFRQSYGWEASADRLKGLALTFLRRDKTRDYAALRKEFAGVYPDIWPEVAAAAAPKRRKTGAVSVSQPASGAPTSYARHFESKNYASCLREIDRLGQASSQPSVQLVKGWCELGQGRANAARAAFETAMTGSGQVRADAIYGNALALLRARLTDEAESLVTSMPLSAARDRELRAEIYFQRARSAFDRKQYQRVLDALDARATLVTETRDLTQLRGWAYSHLGQSERATAVFNQLNLHIRDTGVAAIINASGTN